MSIGCEIIYGGGFETNGYCECCWKQENKTSRNLGQLIHTIMDSRFDILVCLYGKTLSTNWDTVYAESASVICYIYYSNIVEHLLDRNISNIVMSYVLNPTGSQTGCIPNGILNRYILRNFVADFTTYAEKEPIIHGYYMGSKYFECNISLDYTSGYLVI